MQFVYPAFLWAFAAISIPVIIHLFHFRRYKRIIFSDIRFLKQLEEQNRSKQKIKDWLILLCRILAVSALVMAFAQPFIPLGENSKKGGIKNISIFIDNSFSMNAEGSEGPLLEMAKAKARAIINAYGNADKFQILSNDLSGGEQRYINKSDAIARVDGIAPVATSASGEAVNTRQLSGFQTQNSLFREAYIISDFQQSQFNLKQLQNDSNVHYNFIPVKNTGAHNISIDSIYPASPFIKTNEPLTLNIKLSNHGSETVESIVVTVKINNVQKALLNVNISSGESVVTEATLTINDSKWQKGEVSITDYPVTYDDRLFFSFKASQVNEILLLGNGQNKFIDAVFADDANYKLNQNALGNINYQDFNRYNLIIVNEPDELSSGLQSELNKALDLGASVFIIPPAVNAPNLNSFLQSNQLPLYGNLNKQNLKVSEVSQQSALFKNVFRKYQNNSDLPIVNQHYLLQNQNNTKGRSLISLNNGNTLLWQANVRKGSVFLLSSPINPSYTTLPQHSLFVPMMLNMAMGNKKNESLYTSIGSSEYIQLPRNIKPESKLVNVKGNKNNIVSEIDNRSNSPRIHIEGVKQDGWYDVIDQKTNEVLSVAAFNLNRNESSMKFSDESEIAKQTSALSHSKVNQSSATVLGAQISEALSGKSLWRWFVMIALFALISEMVLIRLMK